VHQLEIKVLNNSRNVFLNYDRFLLVHSIYLCTHNISKVAGLLGYYCFVMSACVQEITPDY